MLSQFASQPQFSVPRRHVVRDVAMVATCLALTGGFIAQVSAMPSQRPGASSTALLAERSPMHQRQGRRAAQDLSAFATGAAALYPPCTGAAAR